MDTDDKNNVLFAGQYEDLENHFVIAKLSPAGQKLWDKVIPGPGNGAVMGIGADATGNIFVWLDTARATFNGLDYYSQNQIYLDHKHLKKAHKLGVFEFGLTGHVGIGAAMEFFLAAPFFRRVRFSR